MNMSRNFRLFAMAIAALQLSLLPVSGHALSLQDKTALQVAMQRHVDRQSVNGAYLHLDPATGEVMKLHPVTAHPMIMKMGQNYVLCFDFRDEAGKSAEVDFYMAPKGKTFVVFHDAVANRALLKRLMKAGTVSRAE
jgi:hypothetical protein